MKIIADFHIHSKYSRATSKDMEVRTLARYAAMKGINLLGTGDFTHPQYFAELQGALESAGNGLYKLRRQALNDCLSPPRQKNIPHPNPLPEGERGVRGVHFILSAETSHIFSVKGKTKRVHVILLAPSFEVVEKINVQLAKRGNIASDGRPIFGMHVKDMVKLVLDISPDVMVIPAHAWTPWFSVFGSASGFDSIEECFEEQAKNIYAIETGLSSDPAMNWRLSKLDRITLISNSDSHSPSRIGREANVLDCAMNYQEVMEVIRIGDPKRFLYTIEFFPEEGKYHFDGHRDCGVVFDPKASREHQFVCPKCGKKLTIGVMHRIDELADRLEGFQPADKIPFKRMIPLDEIIADTLGKGVMTQAVEREYQKMVQGIGPELEILIEKSQEEIQKIAGAKIAEAILSVRNGQVDIHPGYDGVYGKIKVLPPILGAEISGSPLQKELF